MYLGSVEGEIFDDMVAVSILDDDVILAGPNRGGV
jgi:hypothetical protein